MEKAFMYFTVAIMLFIHSCTKDDTSPQYDPEEVLVKINLPEPYFYENAFVVLENKETSPVYFKLEAGQTYTIQRGDSIKGETINLHFVYNMFDHVGEVSSYFSVAPGKEIDIATGSGNYPKKCNDIEKSENNTMVDISFTDIPDFDIATRTAMHSGHCHTMGTLEAPCTNIGGNTIASGNPFFVCLQKEDSASYKLITMPNVSDYELSLGELNNNMVRYSIPKSPDYAKGVKVYANGEAGRIAIFNLRNSDNNLFTGNTIDVFVPSGLPEMTTFDTHLSHDMEDHSFKVSSYLNRSLVVTDYSFPETKLLLSPNHSPGDFPMINASSSNSHYVSFRLEPQGGSFFHWDLVAPSFNDFYAVEFPEEVLAIMPDFYRDFFRQDLYIRAETHYDSRITSYNDAVDYLMNITHLETSEEYEVMYMMKWWWESDL